MADPIPALHKAVYGALSALSRPAWDAVPQDTPYPYNTIDTWAVLNDDFIAGQHMSQAFCYLTQWSEARGQAEVLAMQKEIRDAMHEQALPTDDGTVVSVRVETATTARESDNVTFRGSMTLRVLIEH